MPGRAYLTAGAVCDGLDDGLTGTAPVTVPVRTLNAVRREIARPVDFVKCDVEGFELDVFEGGRQVLERDRPVVMCELEDRHAHRYGRTVADVLSFFDEVGYVRIEPARPTAHPPSRNVVLVPRERPLPAAAELPALL